VFNSAVNTTLLLNGMLRRRCCRTPAPAAVDRYVLPVGRSAANPPHAAAAVEQTDGRTDVRTPDRYVDPAAHTMRAVSIRCTTVYQFLNLRRKKTARVMRASTTVVEISSHRTRGNVWKLIRSCERKNKQTANFSSNLPSALFLRNISKYSLPKNDIKHDALTESDSGWAK